MAALTCAVDAVEHVETKRANLSGACIRSLPLKPLSVAGPVDAPNRLFSRSAPTG